MIKRYTNRPKQLNAITFADFAAWYDSNPTYVKQTNILDTDDLLIETRCDDDQNDDDDEDSDVHKSSKSTKKRKKLVFFEVVGSIKTLNQRNTIAN